jgi:hypothetical protein
MEVEFAFGEGSGDELAVGVACVVAIKGAGMDVVALGVGEQRVALLWEFVVGGQRADTAV